MSEEIQHSKSVSSDRLLLAAFRSRFLGPVNWSARGTGALPRSEAVSAHESDEVEPGFVNQARILLNLID
jgi:hypothetical protein